jgi:hypothetical protein
MSKYFLLAAGWYLGQLAAGFELMELHNVNDELVDFTHAHHDGYFQRGHSLEHHLDDEHTRPDADPDRGGGSDAYPVIYPYDDGPHRGDAAAGAMGLGQYGGYRGHGGFPAEREHMGEVYGGEGGNLPYDHVPYAGGGHGDLIANDYGPVGVGGYHDGFEGSGHYGEGLVEPMIGGHGGHYGSGYGTVGGGTGALGGYGMLGPDGHGPDEHDHIPSDFQEGSVPNPDFLGPHPYGETYGIAPNPLHQMAHEEAGDLGKHPHDWKHGHHHAHNPHGRFHHNGKGDLETHLHDDF